METLANIPVINLVILCLTVIGLGVLAQITLLRGKFRLKVKDTEIMTTDMVDRKIEERQQAERKERELQMQLYSHMNKIDRRAESDMMRVIRNIDDKIDMIFGKYTACVFPSGHVYRIVADELKQRIEDNNIREKFSVHDIEGYIDDITYRIEEKYERFLTNIVPLQCGEVYPSWNEIEGSVRSLVADWASREKSILVELIKEKLDYYDKFTQFFKNDYYRKSAIEGPKQKNLVYLEDLGAKKKTF